MNLDKYRYVLNYYRRFEPKLYKDICHNAYLNYWRRNHIDLFDQNIPFIIHVVRHQGIEDWRKKEQTNSRDYDPETYVNKEFISLDPVPDGLTHLSRNREQNKRDQLVFNQAISSRNNPYEEMIAKELLEHCHRAMVKDKRNTARAIQILELKLAGYGATEIGRLLGLTRPGVEKYTKHLQMLVNPINGSKLKPTKQISLNSWEKKTDKEDYELDDENEFYMVFRHKESKDGLLVKLPSGKTNPYINETSLQVA